MTVALRRPLGAAVALMAAVAGLPLLAPTTALAGTSVTVSHPGPIEVPESTITATGVSMTVPDSGAATPYPAPITFVDRPGVITHATVWLLGVSHSHLADLDVMLVAPGGQRVVVMSDALGWGSSELDIGFSDDATSPVPSLGQPFSQTVFQPANYGPGDSFPAPAPSATGAGTSLSVLDGLSPNGAWKLFVVDDSPADSGAIYEWRLDLETSNVADDYPAPVVVSGQAGTVVDVDLGLNGLTHPTPGDLDILLVGPAGQRAMVLSDTGSLSDPESVDLWLDDEATADLAFIATSGTYRPVDDDVDDPPPLVYDHMPQVGDTTGDGSALSAFDGTDPNGTWQLYVVDDDPYEAGSLAGGWTLHLTLSYTPPDPPAPGSAPVPAGSATTGPMSDRTGPAVRRVTPAAGSTTGVGADVLARLSEPVRRRTVTGSTAFLVRPGSSRHLRAAVSYLAGTRTVVIDPRRPLRHRTTYRAVVTTALRDHAGNRLDQRPAVDGLQRRTWLFTTR